MVEGKILT